MSNEYAELSELKSWLGIDATDTRDDAELAIALEAASRQVDRICNRRFYVDSEPSARTYRVAPDRLHVFTDDFSTTTGLVIRTGVPGDFSTALTPGTDLELIGGKEGRAYEGFEAWSFLPVAGNKPTVEVTAKWGWSAVPQDVQYATLLIATRLFKRKDSPVGVLQFTGEGGGIRLGSFDPDVMNALNGYRKAVFS